MVANMKIIQICEQFKPSIGGVQNHVYFLSHELSKRHLIKVFTSDLIEGINLSSKPPSYEKISDTFEVYRFKTYPPYYISYVRAWGAMPFLIQKLVASNADLIHSHSFVAIHTNVTSILSKLKKKPFVLTIHTYGKNLSSFYANMFVNFYNSSIGRITLELADKIIVLSSEAEEYFLQLGVYKEKIQVIPNAVNYEQFANFHTTANFKQQYNIDGKVVLFVSNLQKRKGAQHLIKVIPQIIQELPNTNFVIVGEGPYRKYLENLSNRLQIKNKIIFTGHLSPKKLLEAYHAADVFVLPSAFEGLPTVILEAMASGVPVVASKVGGIPSVIQNGITGFLVNYGDMEQIAEAVTNILSSEKLAKLMGKNGKKISKNYAWSIIYKKIEDVYREVVLSR